MGFFSSLFGFDSSDSFESTDSTDSLNSEFETTQINPANGLPMVGGIGGVDVEGNPYGTDFDSMNEAITDSDNPFSLFEEDMSCSFDDDF